MLSGHCETTVLLQDILLIIRLQNAINFAYERIEVHQDTDISSHISDQVVQYKADNVHQTIITIIIYSCKCVKHSMA